MRLPTAEAARFIEPCRTSPAANLTGGTIAGRLEDYRNRRQDLLLALLDHDADNLDKAAEDLGAFFDRLNTTRHQRLRRRKTQRPDYGF